MWLSNKSREKTVSSFCIELPYSQNFTHVTVGINNYASELKDAPFDQIEWGDSVQFILAFLWIKNRFSIAFTSTVLFFFMYLPANTHEYTIYWHFSPSSMQDVCHMNLV